MRHSVVHERRGQFNKVKRTNSLEKSGKWGNLWYAAASQTAPYFIENGGKTGPSRAVDSATECH